jgi:hypothetical protein
LDELGVEIRGSEIAIEEVCDPNRSRPLRFDEAFQIGIPAIAGSELGQTPEVRVTEEQFVCALTAEYPTARSGFDSGDKGYHDASVRFFEGADFGAPTNDDGAHLLLRNEGWKDGLADQSSRREGLRDVPRTSSAYDDGPQGRSPANHAGEEGGVDPPREKKRDSTGVINRSRD